MLPYRSDDNKTIQYATAPPPLQSANKPYDSDGEPLIASQASEENEEALMNFTATGRPIPAAGFKASGLQSLAGDMYSLPQLLPKQYTDDSIIPAIVTNVIPSEKPEDGKKRRGSFIKMLKGDGKKKEGDKGIVKVVYMQRRDYQKWFARDEKGQYIGSEPFRQWSEAELDETFGKYKPAVKK